LEILAVDRLSEKTPPAGASAKVLPRGAVSIALHGAVIEIDEKFGDPRVQRRQGKEGRVPQSGENSSFSDLDGDFDLAALRPWSRAPRGDA